MTSVVMEPATPETNVSEAEEAVRQAVRALIQRDGLKQSAIAREAGLSGTALSQWLNGKYPGDTAEVAHKLSLWLKAREEREEAVREVITEFPWVETVTAKSILHVLDFAQHFGEMAMISGVPGVGKTRSLRHHAETRPNVWLMTANPKTSACGATLRMVARAIGLHDLRGHGDQLWLDVVQRLRNTRGLLVVDEAQHLSVRAIELLRAIHDELGIGLVLCGNLSVPARITGKNRDQAFAQLSSRIGKRLSLVAPTAEDVVGLATACGITTPDELAFLSRLAVSQEGALRGVEKVLRLASVMAAEGGETLTVADLQDAATDLGLGRFETAKGGVHG